jgi:hypothetical protein
MMRKELKSLQSECVIYWTRKGENDFYFLFLVFLGLMILFQFETLPRQREIQTLSSAWGKDEITDGTNLYSFENFQRCGCIIKAHGLIFLMSNELMTRNFNRHGPNLDYVFEVELCIGQELLWDYSLAINVTCIWRNYSGLLPSEYFWDASVGDLEDAGNVAWPRTRMGQLDDLLAGRIRQRSPVDVDSTQLVDAAMPWMVETKVSYRRALIITLGHFSSNIIANTCTNAFPIIIIQYMRIISQLSHNTSYILSWIYFQCL